MLTSSASGEVSFSVNARFRPTVGGGVGSVVRGRWPSLDASFSLSGGGGGLIGERMERKREAMAGRRAARCARYRCMSSSRMRGTANTGPEQAVSSADHRAAGNTVPG
jgi:hypothetical protein